MAPSTQRNKKRAFSDAVSKRYLSKQLGENGMPEYTTAGLGSGLLALSQMVRGGDPCTSANMLLQSGDAHEVADLIILLFTTRNTRGGKGEKVLSYKMFLEVWKAYPKTGAVLLKLFPHYGYWKDLLHLLEMAKEDLSSVQQDHLFHASIQEMNAQFQKDLKALREYKQRLKFSIDEVEIKELQKNGPAISLLAKWLPRENSSFDKKLSFVRHFAAAVWKNNSVVDGCPESWQSRNKALYRRTVSELTSFLSLPEVLLAAKKEEEICFQKLAAKATLKLRKVFLNVDSSGHRTRSEDPERVLLSQRFIDYSAKKGLKGGMIMPHEIVAAILNDPNMTEAEKAILDAQWKDLRRNVVNQIEEMTTGKGIVNFNPSRMVPMADVSGSMWGTPMEVSIALSILLSEITHDAFKHMILTFASTPTWHRLGPKDSISQKVRSLSRADWGTSTNFEAAYDLILEVVEAAKLEREDMPSLIVFSDMQFDAASKHRSGSNKTMHNMNKYKVKRVATKLGWEDHDPTPIVYWNLRNTGGHPVDKDAEGAVLLAGFSPSLLKLVMCGDAMKEETIEVVEKDGSVVTKKIRLTPEDILRKMLDNKIYDPVREILGHSIEGKLQEYELLS